MTLHEPIVAMHTWQNCDQPTPRVTFSH